MAGTLRVIRVAQYMIPIQNKYKNKTVLKTIHGPPESALCVLFPAPPVYRYWRVTYNEFCNAEPAIAIEDEDTLGTYC